MDLEDKQERTYSNVKNNCLTETEHLWKWCAMGGLQTTTANT